MSYTPTQPDKYNGKQILITSDRLIFNAKDDSILLFSNKAIGFSTNGSFHFDTGEEENSKFVINAPKIYLGLKAEQWLIDLINLLEQILLDFQTGKINQLGNLGAPTTPSPASLNKIKELLKDTGDLKERIKEIKSKQINLV